MEQKVGNFLLKVQPFSKKNDNYIALHLVQKIGEKRLK
jgi:hypothetical protein